MLSLYGYSIAGALFFGMLWRQSFRWRYLSKNYGQPNAPAIETRSWQSGVLLGLGGFNSLKGILKIGLHETGVSLRVLAPFSLFHSPIFIPYGDIRGWRTTWYLDARSTELQFSGAPDIKMVVPAEQAEWIRSASGHKMILRDVSPPQGKAGRVWHAFILIHLAFIFCMVAWFLVHLISQYVI